MQYGSIFLRYQPRPLNCKFEVHSLYSFWDMSTQMIHTRALKHCYTYVACTSPYTRHLWNYVRGLMLNVALISSHEADFCVEEWFPYHSTPKSDYHLGQPYILACVSDWCPEHYAWFSCGYNKEGGTVSYSTHNMFKWKLISGGIMATCGHCIARIARLANVRCVVIVTFHTHGIWIWLSRS